MSATSPPQGMVFSALPPRFSSTPPVCKTFAALYWWLRVACHRLISVAPPAQRVEKDVGKAKVRTTAGRNVASLVSYGSLGGAAAPTLPEKGDSYEAKKLRTPEISPLPWRRW